MSTMRVYTREFRESAVGLVLSPCCLSAVSVLSRCCLSVASVLPQCCLMVCRSA
jgi:transposase-like protein